MTPQEKIEQYVNTKTCVHCPTKEEADRLIGILVDMGRPKCPTDDYPGELCLHINSKYGTTYSNLSWAKKEGYTIISISELLNIENYDIY